MLSPKEQEEVKIDVHNVDDKEEVVYEKKQDEEVWVVKKKIQMPKAYGRPQVLNDQIGNSLETHSFMEQDSRQNYRRISVPNKASFSILKDQEQSLPREDMYEESDFG